MSNLCVECSAPLILKPAGVSRTSGKPYDAFLACSSGQRHSQKKAQFRPQTAHVSDKSVNNGNMVVLEEVQALRADFNKRMNDMATFLVEKLGGDKKQELPPLKDIQF